MNKKSQKISDSGDELKRKYWILSAANFVNKTKNEQIFPHKLTIYQNSWILATVSSFFYLSIKMTDESILALFV